jgi:hypothetical protein
MSGSNRSIGIVVDEYIRWTLFQTMPRPTKSMLTTTTHSVHSTKNTTLQTLAPQNEGSVGFSVSELHSHVTENIFAVFYMSNDTHPAMITVNHDVSPDTVHTLQIMNRGSESAFICQLYCCRFNDEEKKVSQYLGSAVVDLSQCQRISYTLTIQDSSSQPALKSGQVTLVFHDLCQDLMPAESSFEPHRAQDAAVIQQLSLASEANLTWIRGFGKNGLRGIVEGLKLVHSPYYRNHLGVTMPSGAFCMIPTTMDGNMAAALESHREKLLLALARNSMSESTFIEDVDDMMRNGVVKSKHIRCLVVVADAVTSHARFNIAYTPDVQLTPEPRGTERWALPREPMPDGTLCFSGDCEDFAREVYQQCKEMMEWVKPDFESGDVLESMSALLHLYVPTIEQGAVDSAAHSKYITYDAAYRNHIWAALHPRDAWKTKMSHGSCSLEALYAKWPHFSCEYKLPVLHLEGTGDVYPVVTCRKPGFVMKMNHKMEHVRRKYPQLRLATASDMSLQCRHSSTFYKYAIACMTDVFQEQGYLDFTYVTDGKYGVHIYNWARGQYKMVPSTQHSSETMQHISNMIKLERPIFPILNKMLVERKPKCCGGYSVRFGQATRFEGIDDKTVEYGEYSIDDKKWHEIFFRLPQNTSETE